MFFDDYCNDQLQTQQCLNEQNVARGNGISVSVNSDTGRTYGNIAYFKVSNNEDPRNATHEVRLHFYDNGYEIHKGGKKLWEMRTGDKKKLMKLLLNPTKVKRIEFNTTWEALIYCFNQNVKSQDILPINLPIPDYTKTNIINKG